MDGLLSGLLKVVVYFSLLSSSTLVRGDFMLLVNLINYTNPSGLCAECGTASQLVPVCCDEAATSISNCNNTGEERCDTRFRWTIRTFGASLETRPSSDYCFTDCTQSPNTCPFSEMSATFSQGPTAFLGVAENPLMLSEPVSLWTGGIQFYIEPVDSKLPNIIDSLLVNLDSLQLGGDFTEEMMFTGFHNISTMTMSFRVQCSPVFCGPDCSLSSLDNAGIAECHPNGSVVCVEGWDKQTNCSQCLAGYSGNSCSTIESTTTTSSNPPVPLVVGAVVGVLLAALLVLVVVIVLVVCLLRCQQRKPAKRSLAVNSSYESVEAINEQPPPKVSQDGQQDEHDFDNPLYDTSNAPADNDYSSPWDTREEGSAKPIMVSSSNSTHAVVMRVNSSEQFNNNSKKSSVQSIPKQVQYASIAPVPTRRRSYENALLKSAEHDYAEPPNALAPSDDHTPQPVYDRPITPPTHSYEYAEIATSKNDADERVFDNTGEHGLYRSSSPLLKLPPEAELHYDLGQ